MRASAVPQEDGEGIIRRMTRLFFLIAAFCRWRAARLTSDGRDAAARAEWWLDQQRKFTKQGEHHGR